MEPAHTIGFAHFIAQSDPLGKCLLVILLGMSIASWTLIVVKGIAAWRRNRHGNAFLQLFWNATSLDAVRHEIQTHGIKCPFSHLTAHAQHAKEHHNTYGAAKLSEAGTQQEFLIRTMKKVIDEDAARLENGLSVLATIGSTAPFIGLFGTVWGIYNALIAISATGAGTLDKVAGPVGEALIMTGIGLAVAIPAVIGYNMLVRTNNVTLARLDAFANELLTFLSTGKICAFAQVSVQATMQPPVVHNIKRG
ncbi:MotA/TolQ/ExbB proton channel family protein [Oxalobacter vibrioformis]|uniref:Biopolymer transport protein ExbB n=1 Tax=Oxalobacter vibrioformis TaxID=933080 RepID=A0A9E9P3U5_9BURK|nr:MotA/TolQ/ExbB proton channel family protein [Oxalobacter vibrioformis]NLC23441.1 MotA/TolQ/ExbB proton channel family protein [Oxalobacter sp.]WAW10423.1 MotA/TolQ/ExbB proton channel family protein [Oxalobacter vibrioformis]